MKKRAENPTKYSALDLRQMNKAVHKEVKNYQKDGFTIFQVDESVFDCQDFPSTAYSLPNTNIMVPQSPRHSTKAIVMAGITETG